MVIGTFIRYDVVRQVDSESRAIWAVRNVENLGLVSRRPFTCSAFPIVMIHMHAFQLYEMIVDNKDTSKLMLRLNAVINRVSSHTCNAWLWNDVIGRFTRLCTFRVSVVTENIAQVASSSLRSSSLVACDRRVQWLA